MGNLYSLKDIFTIRHYYKTFTLGKNKKPAQNDHIGLGGRFMKVFC